MLDVPYYSQEAASARKYRLDCGVACCAMVIDWAGKGAYPIDSLCDRIGLNDTTGLFIPQIVTLLGKFSIPSSIQRPLTLEMVRTHVNQVGRPVIVLLQYGFIHEQQGHLNANHYCVVVGVDDSHVYLNDPEWYGPRPIMMRGKGLAVQVGEFVQALAVAGGQGVLVNMRGGIPSSGFSSSVPDTGDIFPGPAYVNAPFGTYLTDKPGSSNHTVLTHHSNLTVQTDTPVRAVGSDGNTLYTWVHVTSPEADGWTVTDNLAAGTAIFPPGPFTVALDASLRPAPASPDVSKAVRKGSSGVIMGEASVSGIGVNGNRYVWVSVRMADGSLGWLATAYLNEQVSPVTTQGKYIVPPPPTPPTTPPTPPLAVLPGPAYINTDSLSIHRTPASSDTRPYTRHTNLTILDDAPVTSFGSDGQVYNWVHVHMVDGFSGWAAASYLAQGEATFPPGRTTTLADARLRPAPASPTFKKVLTRGTQLTLLNDAAPVTGYAGDARIYTWVHAQTLDGTNTDGWVTTAFLPVTVKPPTGTPTSFRLSSSDTPPDPTIDPTPIVDPVPPTPGPTPPQIVAGPAHVNAVGGLLMVRGAPASPDMKGYTNNYNLTVMPDAPVDKAASNGVMYTWVRVKMADGYNGWAATAFLAQGAVNFPVGPTKITYSAPLWNSAGSVYYKRTIRPDTVVTILTDTPVMGLGSDGRPYTWVHVQTSDGADGWVATAQLTPTLVP